jgi:oxygen-independent coproporphyrinogen-3 oxidase
MGVDLLGLGEMASVSLPAFSATTGRNPAPAYQPMEDIFAAGREARIAGLYVHVPFCTTKCHYCDFYSVAGHLDQADAYLDALEREIAIQRAMFPRFAPDTIFIGGGTPTLVPPAGLERLLELIRGAAEFSPAAEFTVEANPNTFDQEKAAILVRGGVNRISFGAQSFDPAELAALQRDHDPESVAPAVAAARAAGIDNVNLDLIFGIPGQTLASWDRSLRLALELEPQHLSCYSLIYEPNTQLHHRLAQGAVTPIEEELELTLFEHVYETLRGAGFERYEVSNYARAGRRCRHNMNYWRGENYLAWGPAASGHLMGYRWKNVPALNRYIDALDTGTLPVTELEHLPAARRAGELATLLLRLSDGIDREMFLQKTGFDAAVVLGPIFLKYDGLGLIEVLPATIRLTENAVRVSNTILRDVLTAFERVDGRG